MLIDKTQAALRYPLAVVEWFSRIRMEAFYQGPDENSSKTLGAFLCILVGREL